MVSAADCIFHAKYSSSTKALSSQHCRLGMEHGQGDPGAFLPCKKFASVRAYRLLPRKGSPDDWPPPRGTLASTQYLARILNRRLRCARHALPDERAEGNSKQGGPLARDPNADVGLDSGGRADP